MTLGFQRVEMHGRDMQTARREGRPTYGNSRQGTQRQRLAGLHRGAAEPFLTAIRAALRSHEGGSCLDGRYQRGPNSLIANYE